MGYTISDRIIKCYVNWEIMSKINTVGKKWLTTGKIIFAAVVAFLGWFLSGSNQILSNISSLPKDLSGLNKQAQSWYYDDEWWSGVWSTDTEYMFQISDAQVSTDVDFKMELEVNQGIVSGTISSRKVCELMPLIDGTLLEGRLDNDKIRAVVYEIISNERVNLALIEVRKTNEGIAVVSLRDDVGFIPNEVKAIKQPADKKFSPFCQPELDARRAKLGFGG